MAEPKLQIEKRLDRVEEAIQLMARELGPGFSARIELILGGDTDARKEPEAEGLGVRSEGSGMGEETPHEHQG